MFEEEDDDELFYVVKDIDDFIDHTRKIIFAGFGEQSDEITDTDLDFLINSMSEQDIAELNQTLSMDECLSIVNDYVKPKKTRSGETKWIIADNTFTEIIEAFNARLVSNLLTNLVAEGKIESAYDAEENDFIFWVPDNKKLGENDEQGTS